MCHVIIDLNGGEDVQWCQRKLSGTDGSTSIGQDRRAGKGANVGGFARHVGAGDNP